MHIDDPRIAEKGIAVERSGQQAAFSLPDGLVVRCAVKPDGTLDLMPARSAVHKALLNAVNGDAS